MFGLLKDKNPYEQEARKIYASILNAVRQPAFYRDYGVPDSFDGRFDLLLVHVFMITHLLTGEGKSGPLFNQALFDVCFADMDQTLREQGAGDMSVPKHMRRMMKAFNGRMHVYDEAVSDDKAFESALIRNLYGTIDQPDLEKVVKMRAYIRRSIESIRAQPLEDLMAGCVVFEDV